MVGTSRVTSSSGIIFASPQKPAARQAVRGPNRFPSLGAGLVCGRVLNPRMAMDLGRAAVAHPGYREMECWLTCRSIIDLSIG